MVLALCALGRVSSRGLQRQVQPWVGVDLLGTFPQMQAAFASLGELQPLHSLGAPSLERAEVGAGAPEDLAYSV